MLHRGNSELVRAPTQPLRQFGYESVGDVTFLSSRISKCKFSLWHHGQGRYICFTADFSSDILALNVAACSSGPLLLVGFSHVSRAPRERESDGTPGTLLHDFIVTQSYN